MPDTIVTPNGRPEAAFRIRINGQGATFLVKYDAVERRLLSSIDGPLLDLLDIAASVFAADGTVRRGSDLRSRFGAAWHRSLAFDIPVRHPEIRARPDVSAALCELVAFLGDDDVSFRFRQGDQDALGSRYLELIDTGVAAEQIDEVILFSGGLDSLAGALEVLSTTDRRVALVTHVSSPKMTTRQMNLVAELRKRFPGRILHFPIRATRVGKKAEDTTQRTRSFLFCALGYLVARLLKAKRVSFFENGIIGVNLPIGRQVIGSMATRTTHPLTLELMRRLLAAIGNADIAIENRYQWLTKTEVLLKLDSHGGSDLIEETVSCTRVRDQDVHRTHCGKCTQCLDRRFAILAAGLGDCEPGDRYGIEVLTGPRADDQSRTIAVSWFTHGDVLATITFAAFQSKFANELARVLEAWPPDGRVDALQHLFDLHHRHGEVVRRVIEREIGAGAATMVNHTLPPTSLLAMVANHLTSMPDSKPEVVDFVRSLTIYNGDADDDRDILPLKVWFGADAKGRRLVEIRNLTTITGANAELPHGLLEPFKDDQARSLPPSDHRFVAVADINIGRHVAEATKRQMASRCQDELRAAYQSILGELPPRELLIESSHPRKGGYRLDPTIQLEADPGG